MSACKMVNEFKVGDRIGLYGWNGVVTEIAHEVRTMSDGWKVPCTYLRVSFEKPREVGYQYDGGWYGGSDNIVSYDYIEE